jgi:Na+/H+ antiporter NhaC
MTESWLSLLPPLLVLVSAFITKNLTRSLLLGIVCAAFILTNGSLGDTVTSIGTHFFDHISDPDRLYLYGFLVSISLLITIFSYAGSAIAFAHTIAQKLRTRKMVEGATVGLLSALFIDDYLNVLTVGYVMRPITDKFAIPRAKLAFFIHSLAAPLVILAPISSWVAVITAQLDQVGIAPLNATSVKIVGEPFVVYLQTIPFIFYSLILIGALIFIIYRHISFGPMYTHEQIARKTGNLFGGKEAPHVAADLAHIPEGSTTDLLIPLGILVSSVIVGILYFGGYSLFGGTQSFLGAIQHNTKTELALCIAGLLSLVSSLALTWLHHTLRGPQLPKVIHEGIQLIIPSLKIVVLATIFGAFLKELHTGAYLATTFLQQTPLALLPCILFITSLFMAVITGSAWGTIAILIPLGVQMLLSLIAPTLPVDPANIPLLFPILGAIFSGAVCGNHISPLAETTIMAATSSGSYPLDHIHTQFPYALTVIVSSCIAFISVGFLMPFGKTFALLASLSAGLISCFVLLSLFHYRAHKNSA